MNTNNLGSRMGMIAVILIALFGKVQSQIATVISKPGAIVCCGGKTAQLNAESNPANIAVPAPIATVDSLKIKNGSTGLQCWSKKKA